MRQKYLLVGKPEVSGEPQGDNLWIQGGGKRHLCAPTVLSLCLKENIKWSLGQRAHPIHFQAPLPLETSPSAAAAASAVKEETKSKWAVPQMSKSQISTLENLLAGS